MKYFQKNKYKMARRKQIIIKKKALKIDYYISQSLFYLKMFSFVYKLSPFLEENAPIYRFCWDFSTMWSQTLFCTFWPILVCLGTHDLCQSHRDELGKLDLFGILRGKKGSFSCSGILGKNYELHGWLKCRESRPITKEKKMLGTILRKRASEKGWRQNRVATWIFNSLWSSWDLGVEFS